LLVSGRKHVVIDGLGFDGNYRNQASGLGIGIFITHSFGCAVRNCKFRYFGYAGAPNAGVGINSAGIFVSTSPRTTIESCKFRGNAGYDIDFTSDANGDMDSYSWGCKVLNTEHGVPTFDEANTSTNWWDTQGGGLAGCIIAGNCPAITLENCTIWGSGRFADTFAKGNLIRLTYCDYARLHGCYSDGMIAGYGTVTVTNGSANIVGVPGSGGPAALFNTASGTNGDKNQRIVIEGNATVFRLVTITDGLNAVLDQNWSGATGTVRYRIPMGGDNIGIVSCVGASAVNCTAIYSGDMGFSCGEQVTGVRMDGFTMTGCTVLNSRVCGLVIYGAAKYWSITGNQFGNNHQAGNEVAPVGYRGAIGLDPVDVSRFQLYLAFDGNTFFDDASTPTYAVTFSAVSKANPAVVSAAAHGLITGETVTIASGTGDWAGLNGTRAITVIDADSFSVAVNSSAYASTFGGTIVSNLPWQRVALDINSAMSAQLGFCKWGVNTDNRVTSNLALTGGTNGFTSATLS
jgi:hypothetical protein